MSVTFSPAGNMDYCDTNKLTGETSYDCQCVDFYAPGPDAKCRTCEGKGKVTFPDYPFEANLSNGNAMDVLRMFGIEPHYEGEATAEQFLGGIAFVRAMNATGHEPLVKPTTREGGRVQVIHCGRTPDQVERYLIEFEKIAMEAARRKVLVVWG